MRSDVIDFDRRTPAGEAQRQRERMLAMQIGTLCHAAHTINQLTGTAPGVPLVWTQVERSRLEEAQDLISRALEAGDG